MIYRAKKIDVFLSFDRFVSRFDHLMLFFDRSHPCDRRSASSDHLHARVIGGRFDSARNFVFKSRRSSGWFAMRALSYAVIASDRRPMRSNTTPNW
jgi:hypothetical protein